jgi:DNA-binding GntR family transcriptional regulator
MAQANGRSSKNRERRGEVAYQTVARELRSLILKWEDDDDRLPTEAELVSEYNVGRQTVRRAMQELVSEGIIYRVRGRGTFPAKREGGYIRHFGSVEDLMGLSLDTELEFTTQLRRVVNVEAAGRLHLEADSVVTASFRRLYDGAPFCFTTVYIPPRLLDLLKDFANEVQPGQRSKVTFIGLLDTRMPERISAAEQSITSVPMPSAVAEILDSPPGDPALRIDRLYLGEGGEPVELAVSYFVPSYYSYRVRLRRS